MKLSPAPVVRLGLTPDLTLIHWPSPNEEFALPIYLDQIAEAKSSGLTRHIGDSNFPIALLKEAIMRLGDGEILTNQFELNPQFRNERLATYCKSVGVLVTCYLPVARGRMKSSPVAVAIAARHNATVEQVALAWKLAKGYAAIPTSSRSDRIASNFASLKVRLTPADISALDNLPQEPRSIDPDWGPTWGV